MKHLAFWRGTSQAEPFEVWRALMHDAPFDVPGSFTPITLEALFAALRPTYGSRLVPGHVDHGAEALVCSDGWALWLGDEQGLIVWVELKPELARDDPTVTTLRTAAHRAGYSVFISEDPEQFWPAAPQT
ncbi:MAG: hypothetical protein JNK82_02535 [Myxococcaceae bacterium]|nr:hypothetical protein [Myxococcaceae bacterium]